MDYVGPFTFNAVRCLIGAAVLIPVILFMDKSARKSGLTDEEMKSRRGDTKTLITGGICCGLALGIASSLQQWGISITRICTEKHIAHSEHQRIVRLCAHVWSYYSGTAAGENEGIRKLTCGKPAEKR